MHFHSVLFHNRSDVLEGRKGAATPSQTAPLPSNTPLGCSLLRQEKWAREAEDMLGESCTAYIRVRLAEVRPQGELCLKGVQHGAASSRTTVPAGRAHTVLSLPLYCLLTVLSLPGARRPAKAAAADADGGARLARPAAVGLGQVPCRAGWLHCFP